MATEKDQEFLEYVVKAVVDKADAVEVKRSIDEMGVLLELKVDPEDMGKVIGKDGQTAKAIRVLLRILGAKNDARVNMKIIEPEGSTHRPKSSGPMKEEMKPAKEEKKDEDLDVDVKL
jgi:predicted RNA-binding protein YlqC (UPF0109 family)